MACQWSYDANNHWYASTCGNNVTDGLEAHSGGIASCTTQAVCDACGASYGVLYTLNHDEKRCFSNDGFCPNGCNEPAMLNGSVYVIENAGQYGWFAQQVNSGNHAINGSLTNDINIHFDRFATAPGPPIGNGHTLTIKRKSRD